MKLLSFVRVLAGLGLAVTETLAQPELFIFPSEAPANELPLQVVWPTHPSVRYELQESKDLRQWSTLAGFPSRADALARQHAFSLEGGNRFFRVSELDEQPPTVVARYPADKAFAVSRFSPISVSLADRTGVAPASVRLAVGGHGVFTLSSALLSFAEDQLILDLGPGVALGGFGSTVPVTLEIADTLGNATTVSWTFDLEFEAVTASNMFVFGSSSALRAGQLLDEPAAALASRVAGPAPVPVSRSDDLAMAPAPVNGWRLDAVETDKVIITYTGGSAPAFAVGQLITNMAPARISEIFYRRVEAVSNDAANKRLTLMTSDSALTNFLVEGSFDLSKAVFLELDENGNLMRSLSLDTDFTLPALGADFSSRTIYSDGAFTLTVPEAKALFHPSLRASLETRGGRIERFQAQVGGDIEIAIVPQLTVTGSYNDMVSHPLLSWSHWLWTSVGPVPVGIELTFEVEAAASVNVSATSTMTTGFRQNASLGVSGRYVQGAAPAVTWERWFEFAPTQTVPFTYTLAGQAGATVSIVPRFEVRLYGAAGIYLSTDPRLELSASPTLAGGALNDVEWSLGAYADVNAGLSILGVNDGQLPTLPLFRLFTHEWGGRYPLTGAATPLAITRQPLPQRVRPGDTVVFDVEASGGSGGLSYQWYQDGVLLPSRTGRKLRLTGVGAGFVGAYRARVRDEDGKVVNSAAAKLELVTAGPTGPVYQVDEHSVISASFYYSHSLFLKNDGTVWAAGVNWHGQLGDGTLTAQSTPALVMSGVKAVSAGETHSLFLKNDGTVWAAGGNWDGQLGDGTFTNRPTPVQVMSGVKAVSGGGHSLFLKNDGTVWAAGWNGLGQLGDGTFTSRPTPVLVMSGVKAISTGGGHSLFLKNDGTVWAAGGNWYGQLGNGTTADQPIPVPVMSGVTAVSAGYYYSLFLRTDGTVWAAGRNWDGQLGDGTFADRPTPVPVMNGVKAVSGGVGHSLFLRNDGTVWAAGVNFVGQLGDGTFTSRPTPVPVIRGAKAISAGHEYSLFLMDNGTVWAVGRNWEGQLGDGTLINRYTPVPIMSLIAN